MQVTIRPLEPTAAEASRPISCRAIGPSVSYIEPFTTSSLFLNDIRKPAPSVSSTNSYNYKGKKIAPEAPEGDIGAMF